MPTCHPTRATSRFNMHGLFRSQADRDDAFSLGLLSCLAAVISYGMHALQFWPANPAPDALLGAAWMLSVFGIILGTVGVWDRRERHPLDFLGIFMNVLSFVVPAWLLH